MAVVKPFRAERYDESKAGPLERLVAPPYDVISPEQREEYLARSPYNVVHLTLPDDEEQAGRGLRDWREQGVLTRDAEPACWSLSQDYVGPDGVARTRSGLVASLRVEPYENGVVLPHERTHAGPKEGRLRLLRATRTQLEPIFLLYEAEPSSRPRREPDLQSGGDKLWRIDDAPSFENTELLIADGHHRYETALAYAQEGGSRVHDGRARPDGAGRADDLPYASHRRTHQRCPRHADRRSRETSLPGVVLYRDGQLRAARGRRARRRGRRADRTQGVTYTPQRADAVAAVDRGDAEAAFLLRPTPHRGRLGGRAPRRDDAAEEHVLLPKLTSGLLFHPLD